ncbi:MAG TPA: SIS domain-containing protein [bacterium]|nr:SIS domain-containing protein [bacterium]
MKELLGKSVSKHQEAVENSFNESQLAVLESIGKELLKTLKGEHKILLCGNGGSAADSQHIAAEFVARFKRERRSLPAMALTTDTSILTAVANDYDFQQVFSRQIEGLGQKGDALIAISTSGKSRNVLEAIRQAKHQGLCTIGFTGGTGGNMKEMADICFVAQSSDTSHIQEIHITALHAISEAIENIFFGA